METRGFEDVGENEGRDDAAHAVGAFRRALALGSWPRPFVDLLPCAGGFGVIEGFEGSDEVVHAAEFLDDSGDLVIIRWCVHGRECMGIGEKCQEEISIFRRICHFHMQSLDIQGILPGACR